MSASQIRELRSMGMEVGAHTVTHQRLTSLGSEGALWEVITGREMLEQILGEPVISFCYPEGKFSSRDRELVRQSGYRLARTTVAFRTDSDFEPDAMPVGFQLYPHSCAVLARHALREHNLCGLTYWYRYLGCEDNPVSLAARMVTELHRRGGILHIWGHSWELDRANLWPMLEAVLDVIANQPGIQYTSNAGVLDAITSGRKVEPVFA